MTLPFYHGFTVLPTIYFDSRATPILPHHLHQFAILRLLPPNALHGYGEVAHGSVQKPQTPYIYDTLVGLTDGDTLKLLTENKKTVKIRLAEIDTPERRQPYGKRAKQALSALTFKINLSQDDFSEHRASSITIAGPLARATVFLTTGILPSYGFTLSVLMGIVAGALASALLTRSFHLIIPEAHHLKHLLAGGALMGIGAICAGGCNIGAGLTGMSTGSIRALTAVVGIVAGMLLGIALLTRTEKVDERDYHHHPTTHSVGA